MMSDDIMSLPRDEQETTISWMRDDDEVMIYTSNRVHLDRLRKLSSDRDYVREVRGAATWGEFRVSADSFKLFSAIRAKRTMSDEQREAAAERLRAVRADG